MEKMQNVYSQFQITLPLQKMHAYDNLCNNQSASRQVVADWPFEKLQKAV